MDSIKKVGNVYFNKSMSNNKIADYIQKKLVEDVFFYDKIGLNFFNNDEVTVNEEWKNTLLIVDYLNDEVQDSQTLNIETIHII